MKKILISFFVLFVSLFFFINVEAGDCDYNKGKNIHDSLVCLNDMDFIRADRELNTDELNNRIYNLSKTLAIVLSLGAIFGIVYGSFYLVTAGGEDEKIKKGKDVIKWSIIGFLGIVSASSLIVLIVNVFYDIGPSL